MGYGQIGESLGGALGGIAVMAGAAGEGGREELAEAVRLAKQIQRPEFDMRELTPAQLKIVAEYFPQYYSAHVEGPVSLTQDSPEVRRKLGENLDYFARIRDQGMPLSERIAALEAQRTMSGAHRAATESSLRDLQRRGRAGGGLEAAMRLGASQQASELGRGMANDLATRAEQTRYGAGLNLASLGGALRGQDIGLSSERAGQLNRFNEWISNMLTEQARENSARAQQAQWQNAQTAQGIANANEMSSYETALANLNRRNQLAQQDFSNQLGQVGAVTNALGGLSQGKYAEQAAMRDNIMNVGRGAGAAIGGMMDPNLGKEQPPNINFFYRR